MLMTLFDPSTIARSYGADRIYRIYFLQKVTKKTKNVFGFYRKNAKLFKNSFLSLLSSVRIISLHQGGSFC